MSMTDPIADMLTRFRNGQKARKVSVAMPNSGAKVAVAKVPKDEGYITGYNVIDDGRQGHLDVTLKYGQRGEKVIGSIKRVSKPGCRTYSKTGDLPRPLQGLGIAIVSTSSGIMSDRKCRELSVGGEIVAIVT